MTCFLSFFSFAQTTKVSIDKFQFIEIIFISIHNVEFKKSHVQIVLRKT